VSETEPTAVVVQRVIAASPEVVYEEWIDPEAMAVWMCPRPARAAKIELDPRVGGRLQIDVDDSGQRVQITGTFLELVPGRRLRFSWSCSNWVDPNCDSVVTVTLEPRGQSQTFMTIHHVLLPPDAVDSHEKGWTQVAQQLDDTLQTRD
jgi:uncharacterized protein YndB with AHSA1/START domain